MVRGAELAICKRSLCAQHTALRGPGLQLRCGVLHGSLAAVSRLGLRQHALAPPFPRFTHWAVFGGICRPDHPVPADRSSRACLGLLHILPPSKSNPTPPPPASPTTPF